MSIKSQVLTFAAGQVEVTAKEAAEHIGVSPKEATNALAALARSGELTRVGRGKYTTGTTEAPRKTHAKKKVRIKKKAAVDELVTAEAIELTEAMYSGDTDGLVAWITAQFDLDPTKVAVARAYYEEFVAPARA